MTHSKIIIKPSPDEIAALSNADCIGFDIETSIADHPREGKIRLYQAYVPSLDSIIVWDTMPMQGKGGTIYSPTAVESNWSFKTLLDVLKNPDIEKRIHNALFEYGYIREHHEIRIKNILDTMILAQITRAGLYTRYAAIGIKNCNGLAALSEEYGLNLDKTYQNYDYDDPTMIPWDVYEYACNDAWATWKLGELIPRPKQDIDLRVVDVFGEMNATGMPVSMERIHETYQAYQKCRDELKALVEEKTKASISKEKLKEIYDVYALGRDKLKQLDNDQTELSLIVRTRINEAYGMYVEAYENCQEKLLSLFDKETVLEEDIEEIYNLSLIVLKWLKNIVAKKSKVSFSSKEMLEMVWNSYEMCSEILKKMVTGCNPNSSAQLLEWIEETFGMVPKVYDRKTRSKKPSTSKPAINDFITTLQRFDVNSEDVETLKRLQEYRSVNKRLEYPKEYMQRAYNGRIYSKYSVLGYQGTGRSSSSKPNTQNVANASQTTKKYKLPKIRSMFEAQEGWVFVECDAAACHSQIARFYSRDAKLIEANESGIKLHYFTLQGILAMQGIHMEVSEIAKAKEDEDHPQHDLINQWYHLSKTTFYSGLNMSGAETLKMAFLKEDNIVSYDQCDKMLKATAKTYVGLRKFQLAIGKKVESRMEIVKTVDGRSLGKCGYLDLPAVNARIYFRYPMHLPDCLSAIWLKLESVALKTTLLRMQNLIDEPYVGEAEIVNFSHDSIMIHCDEKHARTLGQILTDTLIEELKKVCPDYTHEYEGKFLGRKEALGYDVKKLWKE